MRQKNLAARGRIRSPLSSSRSHFVPRLPPPPLFSLPLCLFNCKALSSSISIRSWHHSRNLQDSTISQCSSWFVILFHLQDKIDPPSLISTRAFTPALSQINNPGAARQLGQVSRNILTHLFTVPPCTTAQRRERHATRRMQSRAEQSRRNNKLAPKMAEMCARERARERERRGRARVVWC